MTGPDSGGEACARCGVDPVSHAYPGSPAYQCVYVATPASTAPDSGGLREAAQLAVARWLAWACSGEEYADQAGSNEHWREMANEVLNLPALAALLAERDEAERRTRLAWDVHSEHVDRMNVLLLQAQAERDEVEARLAAVRELPKQWDDMAGDHDNQGATNTAFVYRAHAKHVRRALGDAP